MPSLTTVTVLLATHNGAAWIEEQLESILNQDDVPVSLWVSDDQSSDQTVAMVDARANRSDTIRRLPSRAFGSAAGNFFYLLENLTSQAGVGAVALSDQDDVWHRDKLRRAVTLIESGTCDAVSTSVIAFWPDGRRQLIDKGATPRLSDHWFESAGPGCTYVLSASTAMALSSWVSSNRDLLRDIQFHDWLIYAWVRSRGYRWHIDPEPSMDYRQHDSNVLGAHAGFSGKLKRLRMLFNGWYFTQVLHIATACGGLSHPLIQRLRRDRWVDRLTLVVRVGQMRRKAFDRVVLAMALLFGWRHPS